MGVFSLTCFVTKPIVDTYKYPQITRVHWIMFNNNGVFSFEIK
jgi:hypothetical protein